MAFQPTDPVLTKRGRNAVRVGARTERNFVHQLGIKIELKFEEEIKTKKNEKENHLEG